MARDRMRALMPFVCAPCRQSPRPSLAGPTVHHRTMAARTTTRSPRTIDYILAGSKADKVGNSFNFENLSDLVSQEPPSLADTSIFNAGHEAQPHRLHILCTKHNTHITLTGPGPRPLAASRDDIHLPPVPNMPLISSATGNLGYKKAARGTYDAAYQLASFTLKKIQDKGLLPTIKALEIVLRGAGPGRDSVVKAILGSEGRLIRPKVVAVSDATRLKFGGSRSPRPRRLG